MSKRPVLLGAFSALLLGACATLPSGPSVMVLPGAQKTFEQFRADDALCQFYRRAMEGGTPRRGARDSRPLDGRRRVIERRHARAIATWCA